MHKGPEADAWLVGLCRGSAQAIGHRPGTIAPFEVAIAFSGIVNVFAGRSRTFACSHGSMLEMVPTLQLPRMVGNDYHTEDPSGGTWKASYRNSCAAMMSPGFWRFLND